MEIRFPNEGRYASKIGDGRCEGFGRNGPFIAIGLSIIDCQQFGYLSIGAINSRNARAAGVRIDIPADPDWLERLARKLDQMAGNIRRVRCDAAVASATALEENPFHPESPEGRAWEEGREP